MLFGLSQVCARGSNCISLNKSDVGSFVDVACHDICCFFEVYIAQLD